MKRLLMAAATLALFGAGCGDDKVVDYDGDVRGDSLYVVVEKTDSTYQGSYEVVSVYFEGQIDTTLALGGYDMLLQYDAAALTFQAAQPGSLLEACGWEYFTYRYGASGNCGDSTCPPGVVRVVAIAETNNGANYADCFSSMTDTELLTLTFLVTNDRTFECMYVPVRFIWYDCGDNTISSKTGDTLFISRHVYEYPLDTSTGLVPVEDPEAEFPTLLGAPDSCESYRGSSGVQPCRVIDFRAGGIEIVCADSIHSRGDINLDGQAYTIADALLFSDYFIYGRSVFTINVEGQVAATDVLPDGIVLSVPDLVYLVRIVIGDALPYPKLVKPPTPIAARLIIDSTEIRIEAEELLGAVQVVLSGNVTPTLLVNQMELKYAYDAAEDVTRLLVWSIDGERFGNESLLSFDSEPQIVTIEAASAEGRPVVFTTM